LEAKPIPEQPASHPSPRLPPTAVVTDVEPPGLPWRPPAETDNTSKLLLSGSKEKGGGKFLLTVSMLDSMLRKAFCTTQTAQAQCFDEFPETVGCQQDEFISFDGTLTTVYEDEDFDTKRQRAELPREATISCEDTQHLWSEYSRIRDSISELTQKRPDDASRIRQVEETRRDLRAELEQNPADARPAAGSEIEDVAARVCTTEGGVGAALVEGPIPLDGLGIAAVCQDARGTCISEVEVKKLLENVQRLSQEADQARGNAATSQGRKEEAAAAVLAWEKERSELSAHLPPDAKRELIGAVQALLQKRSRQKSERSTLQEMASNTPVPPALTPPMPGSAAIAGRRHLVGSTIDRGHPRGGVSAVPRGRLGTRSTTTQAGHETDAKAAEAKLQQLSTRFTQVQRQYRDLIGENKRLRDLIGGVRTPIAMSRSEARLPTTDAGSVSSVPGSTEGDRARSSSSTSRGSASDHSLGPSSASDHRDRSLDGSQSTDRSPGDVWSTDDECHPGGKGSSGLDGLEAATAALWGPPVLSGQPIEPSLSGVARSPDWPGMPAWPASDLPPRKGRHPETTPGTSSARTRGSQACPGNEQRRIDTDGSGPTAPCGRAGRGPQPERSNCTTRSSREALHPPQSRTAIVSGPRQHHSSAGRPRRRVDPGISGTSGSGNPSALWGENRQRSRGIVRYTKNPADAQIMDERVIHAGGWQDADQQPAPEPLPESGVPSPPVAHSMPAPPTATDGASRFFPRGRTAMRTTGLVSGLATPVAMPTTGPPRQTAPTVVSSAAWDRHHQTSLEGGDPIGPAESPGRPRQASARSAATSPPTPLPACRPPTAPASTSPLMRGQVQSASASSLGSVRTPSPAIARSTSASLSPGPDSSRSPSIGARVSSPIVIAQADMRVTAVAAAAAAGRGPRNSRATWPTPAAHAQFVHGGTHPAQRAHAVAQSPIRR